MSDRLGLHTLFCLPASLRLFSLGGSGMEEEEEEGGTAELGQPLFLLRSIQRSGIALLALCPTTI